MALSRAAKADDVLVSIHPRRLGIVGDGLPGSTSALLLDGKVIGTSRNPIKVCQVASNGAGAVTLAGAVVGDVVESVVNLTTPGDVTSSFESVISVAGQIQQTAATNLSAAQCLFQVSPRS
ncbi:hypothetical protein ACVWW6_006040 [Bradyrhizobium sp. USDA 3311]